MNLLLNTLRLAALTFAAAVFLTSCEKAGSTTQSPQAKPVLSVNLINPRDQTWSKRITASGNIQPWQEVSIGAEVSGVRVTQVLVNVGDMVKKGELLARLDDRGTIVDLKLQRAAVAEVEANLDQADLSVKRARRLDDSRAISQQDLMQFETQAKTAAAKLAMAQAQVEVSQLRLHHTRIVAPDDGVISASFATVGALSDRTPELFRLIRKGRIEWRAELRPEEQANVQTGQTVELRDPLGRLVTGQVRKVAPTADPNSRTSLVYVDVSSDGVLKPGVLATGDFVIAKQKVLTIPQSAVVLRDGYSFVFKVGADHRVKQSKVDLGSRKGDDVEVLDGLKPGDSVVAAGGVFLSDGDLVQVVQAPPTMSTTATSTGARSLPE